ncbi:hypothetical protein WJT86_12080 [Microvirga sp. W0021]|uniref:Uncharacterized protein n=1 Tax=Hohaiivirga grylli TaxID=3133970 RepID=A0ABV0BNP4_9HYPH
MKFNLEMKKILRASKIEIPAKCLNRIIENGFTELVSQDATTYVLGFKNVSVGFSKGSNFFDEIDFEVWHNSIRIDDFCNEENNNENVLFTFVIQMLKIWNNKFNDKILVSVFHINKIEKSYIARFYLKRGDVSWYSDDLEGYSSAFGVVNSNELDKFIEFIGK